MIPNETTLHCSRCSSYNLEDNCCLCKECLGTIIDGLKMKKINDFGISMAGKYRNQGMLEYCRELKQTLLTDEVKNE